MMLHEYNYFRLLGWHISLKGDKKFLVSIGFEEFVGVGRVKVRDVNGDFIVLDLFGSVGGCVDGRSHHEPTNDGPSA